MVYNLEKQQLINQLKGKHISITVDESTDVRERSAVNILFSFVNYTKLVVTDHLTIVNNITISQLVIKTLNDYSIPFENIILFISDNAAYMLKSFRNLSTIIPQMKHNCCLAHIYNLVGETWIENQNFHIVNDIVSNIKTSFTYSSARKSRWLNYLTLNSVESPTLPSLIQNNSNLSIKPTLPPLPVKTRWNSWFNFIFWIKKYLPYLASFFLEENNICDSKAVQNICNYFNNTTYMITFEIFIDFIHFNAQRYDYLFILINFIINTNK